MRPTLLLAPLLLGCVTATTAEAAEAWPRWRGPLGTGEAPGSNPPVTFGLDENLRWRAEIPGKGKGTPIVLGDRVYVLTAVGVGDEIEPEEEEEEDDGGRGRRGRRGSRGIQPTQTQRFLVLALDRATGEEVWRDVCAERLPHEGTHQDASWASASAVTDGEVLLAYFGSFGLFAYDLDGKRLWEKQLGEMRTRRSFGEGSSPAVHGETVVVQWDHEEDDFIVALDRKTGKERWRRERDEPTTWATPLVVEVDGRAQVIANGTNAIRAYDLETGDTVWECGGMTVNAIPTPVHADGVVYVMSGFRGSALLAIRLSGAKGDLAGGDHVVWSHDRDTPYVPSPLLVDGKLYFLKVNTGILTCFDVEAGEPLYGPMRLESVANVYASPVAGGGRVYLAGRDGEVEVIEIGPEYKLLASNEFDDGFDASPAIVGNELYLRGRNHVYCFATGADEAREF